MITQCSPTRNCVFPVTRTFVVHLYYPLNKRPGWGARTRTRTGSSKDCCATITQRPNNSPETRPKTPEMSGVLNCIIITTSLANGGQRCVPESSPISKRQIVMVRNTLITTAERRTIALTAVYFTTLEKVSKAALTFPEMVGLVEDCA